MIKFSISTVTNLFQVLAEIWRKWRQILKNTTRAEIIIIISTAIRIKNNKDFGKYLRAIFYIVIISSTRVVYDVIFSNSQSRLGTRKINWFKWLLGNHFLSFRTRLAKVWLQRKGVLLSKILWGDKNPTTCCFPWGSDKDKVAKVAPRNNPDWVELTKKLEALEEENKLLSKTNLHLNDHIKGVFPSQWNGFFLLVLMGCVRWESFPVSTTTHPLNEKLSPQNTPGVDQKTCFTSLQFFTHPNTLEWTTSNGTCPLLPLNHKNFKNNSRVKNAEN